MSECVCPYCKTTVNFNYELHVIRCQRCSFYCDKCNSMVSLDDKGKHVEAHVNEKYPTQDPTATFAHEPTTVVPKCPYCQLRPSFEEAKAHFIHCGNDTSRCQHCNRRIMNKNMARHLELHRTERDKVAPQQRGKMLGSSKITASEIQTELYSCPFCADRHSDFDQLRSHIMSVHYK